MFRQLDLKPGVVGHRLQLPDGDVRLLVIDMVSLVPGTVSASSTARFCRCTPLNVGSDVHDQLGELEERVSRVAGRSPP